MNDNGELLTVCLNYFLVSFHHLSVQEKDRLDQECRHQMMTPPLAQQMMVVYHQDLYQHIVCTIHNNPLSAYLHQMGQVDHLCCK